MDEPIRDWDTLIPARQRTIHAFERLAGEALLAGEFGHLHPAFSAQAEMALDWGVSALSGLHEEGVFVAWWQYGEHPSYNEGAAPGIDRNENHWRGQHRAQD